MKHIEEPQLSEEESNYFIHIYIIYFLYYFLYFFN